MKEPTPFWACVTTLFAGMAIREADETNFEFSIDGNTLLSHPSLFGNRVCLASLVRRLGMTVSSRRILILGRPKSGKLSLVKSLTSSLPSGLTHETTPHAGLTHSITLTTRYFTTEAGIWIDEIPDDTETWLEEYLSQEASPVLQSLAAVIVTVDPTSDTEHILEIVRKLNERGEEVEWDGLCLVVGKQGQSDSGTSSLCEDLAMEYIDLDQSGENEYGGNPLQFR
jgi:hypothetical protein